MASCIHYQNYQVGKTSHFYGIGSICDSCRKEQDYEWHREQNRDEAELTAEGKKAWDYIGSLLKPVNLKKRLVTIGTLWGVKFKTHVKNQ